MTVRSVARNEVRQLAKVSAGILFFRRCVGSQPEDRSDDQIEVLLGHPGGPFYARKVDGVWTLPKGLLEGDEEPLAAARREFCEETGFDLSDRPDAEFLSLGEIRYKNGKVVMAWGLEGDCDPLVLVSNVFEIEWPPRTGKQIEVPELDRFAFFSVAEASDRVHPAQLPFLKRLLEFLAAKPLE